MNARILARCLAVPMFVVLAGMAAAPKVALASTWVMAEGNATSRDSVVSADGRWVAYQSFSSDLVTGDTNGHTDVFLQSLETGDTTLVSVDSSGTLGNNESLYPSISADGRYVAFSSRASNLVEGDTNDKYDIFVHDCLTGATVRVGLGVGGAQPKGSPGDPVISGDGQVVVFESSAANLVPGDTNKSVDVFAWDMVTGTTSRVSVRSSNTQAKGVSVYPAVSADGRYVTFVSFASNLVSGDTNGRGDVFIRDRTNRVTTRVSVDSSEHQYAKNSSTLPSISADGRYVAFESGYWSGTQFGHTDIYVRDRSEGTTKLISGDSFGAKGNRSSYSPAISADGRYVAYGSGASNLVQFDFNGDDDVFKYDRVTGITTRVSVDSAGAEVNGDAMCKPGAISGDGRFVGFEAAWIPVLPHHVDRYGVYVCDTSGLPAEHPVSNPHAPSTMSHTKSYTVYGYLKPRHTAGTSPVNIYMFKKNSSGDWIFKGYVTANASDYSSYTKYSTSLKLSSAGKWRLVACAVSDVDHVETWSAWYDSVTVK